MISSIRNNNSIEIKQETQNISSKKENFCKRNRDALRFYKNYGYSNVSLLYDSIRNIFTRTKDKTQENYEKLKEEYKKNTEDAVTKFTNLINGKEIKWEELTKNDYLALTFIDETSIDISTVKDIILDENKYTNFQNFITNVPNNPFKDLYDTITKYRNSNRTFFEIFYDSESKLPTMDELNRNSSLEKDLNKSLLNIHKKSSIYFQDKVLEEHNDSEIGFLLRQICKETDAKTMIVQLLLSGIFKSLIQGLMSMVDPEYFHQSENNQDEFEEDIEILEKTNTNQVKPKLNEIKSSIKASKQETNIQIENEIEEQIINLNKKVTSYFKSIAPNLTPKSSIVSYYNGETTSLDQNISSIPEFKLTSNNITCPENPEITPVNIWDFGNIWSNPSYMHMFGESASFVALYAIGYGLEKRIPGSLNFLTLPASSGNDISSATLKQIIQDGMAYLIYRTGKYGGEYDKKRTLTEDIMNANNENYVKKLDKNRKKDLKDYLVKLNETTQEEINKLNGLTNPNNIPVIETAFNSNVTCFGTDRFLSIYNYKNSKNSESNEAGNIKTYIPFNSNESAITFEAGGQLSNGQHSITSGEGSVIAFESGDDKNSRIIAIIGKDNNVYIEKKVTIDGTEKVTHFTVNSEGKQIITQRKDGKISLFITQDGYFDLDTIDYFKHEIIEGDTIHNLAEKYGVEENELLGLNQLTKDEEGITIIYPGNYIKIPISFIDNTEVTNWSASHIFNSNNLNGNDKSLLNRVCDENNFETIMEERINPKGGFSDGVRISQKYDPIANQTTCFANINTVTYPLSTDSAHKFVSDKLANSLHYDAPKINSGISPDKFVKGSESLKSAGGYVITSILTFVSLFLLRNFTSVKRRTVVTETCNKKLHENTNQENISVASAYSRIKDDGSDAGSNGASDIESETKSSDDNEQNSTTSSSSNNSSNPNLEESKYPTSDVSTTITGVATINPNAVNLV